MDTKAKWIWLDPVNYPEHQEGFRTWFSDKRKETPYFAAEFRKTVQFQKKITDVHIDVSGDTKFHLYVSGYFVGSGPVCHGGDYGFDGRMPYHYYNHYDISSQGQEIEFYALVEAVPSVQCDISSGVCGFILCARILFEDGSFETVSTDESWLARLDRRRIAVNQTDMTMEPDEWSGARITRSDRVMRRSPIENLVEEEIVPGTFQPFVVEPGESKEFDFELDRIYAGFYRCETEGTSEYKIIFRGYEREHNDTVLEEFVGTGTASFRALRMTSVGGFLMSVQNIGSSPLWINKLAYIFTHYPCPENGSFRCSDELLNRIYDTGKWAVKICKQTLELDSPMHQENLGCTGDYMISSLMNYVTYGNPDVTRFDIIRTADYLKVTGGKMFHTTYSMLWIQMLYDYYMFTGDRSILEETRESLGILMERFHSYVGTNGIIDNPPDYMFIDWLVVDGYTMHHPPKAMGQASLTAFYHGGLLTAAAIAEVLGDRAKAVLYRSRGAALKEAFRALLYDAERGLYCDGLNDNTYEPKVFLPANTDKRYFSWHTNTLAVLYGICEGKEATELMERILNDMTLTNPQPYFMHFVLEAIYKTGLFEKYGLDQIRRWRVMTDFSKGLQEGWYAPPGEYHFDYSHVWGGTPTYQLPVRLAGLEIRKAGFEEISLKPQLFGLKYAKIRIPTPLGNIEIDMEEGRESVVRIPAGICVRTEGE